MTRRALVLGARSWLGHWLLNALRERGFSVTGTTSKEVRDLNRHCNNDIIYIMANDSDSIESVIRHDKPELIFNLLIGIGSNEFEIHQRALSIAEAIGAKYVYASSALALDGYLDERLVDSLPPLSISDYGKFKSRCELELMGRSSLDSMICRFSSAHGWSPWKDTRTISFLKKMASNSRIIIDRGVIQNRLIDSKLVDILMLLGLSDLQGVFHIGTTDASEEFVFLERLAEAFGYDKTNVFEGKYRGVNLNVIPSDEVLERGGVTENDTITALLALPYLSKYKKTTD